jgi:hypothetical protein
VSARARRRSLARRSRQLVLVELHDIELGGLVEAHGGARHANLGAGGGSVQIEFSEVTGRVDVALFPALVGILVERDAAFGEGEAADACRRLLAIATCASEVARRNTT